MKDKLLLLFVLLIILFASAYLFQNKYALQKKIVFSPASTIIISQTPVATTAATVLGVQIKSSDCHSNGALQDKDCTPGAIFVNATKDDVCISGYAKNVRNVSESEKKAVFAEYGIVTHATGEYEVDHLISLELGGSNDIANLWPEAAAPVPGFHEKDRIENLLHDEVCSGRISLHDAQMEIANDWISIYNQLR